MNKAELIKRFTELVDLYERDRSFGSIEIVFQGGRPEYIKRQVTEKPQKGIPYEHRNR